MARGEPLEGPGLLGSWMLSRLALLVPPELFPTKLLEVFLSRWRARRRELWFLSTARQFFLSPSKSSTGWNLLGQAQLND